MNGFEKHNINHLSPSSIKTWCEAPDVWITQKLMKRYWPAGPAATRGTVVEDAVVRALSQDLKTEQVYVDAEREFDSRHAIQLPDVLKEREYIKPMIDQALIALRPYGKPDFDHGSLVDPYPQHEVIGKTKLPDGSIVKFIGFLDFKYPAHGLIVDLKTTTRMPSKMSFAHKIQAAFYAHSAGNMGVKFCYVTPKKFDFLENLDVSETLKNVKQFTIQLNNFLLAADSAEHAISMVPHLPDTFYWRGGEDVRKELFNT